LNKRYVAPGLDANLLRAPSLLDGDGFMVFDTVAQLDANEPFIVAHTTGYGHHRQASE
jgi:hypothetical protein